MSEKGRIRLQVVTPREAAFDGEVDSVNVPGLIGEFGVLPLHQPMLAATKPGVLYTRSEGREEVFVIGPGFAEVEHDQVVILTDRCEKGSAIDPDEAQKGFEALEAKYKSFSGDTTGSEFVELEREYQWAVAALDASRRSR